MIDKFPPLSFQSMPVGAGYSRPDQEFPGGLTTQSPALTAMTDLRKVTALTVELPFTKVASEILMPGKDDEAEAGAA